MHLPRWVGTTAQVPDRPPGGSTGSGRVQRWRGRRTAAVAVLAAVMTMVSATAALAVVIDLPPNSGGITTVGPISGENGFPVWYKDKNNVALQLCLDGSDPNCVLPGAGEEEGFDPAQPTQFPTNYPGEAFYYSAGSSLTTGAAGRALIEFAIEATFANEVVQNPDQIVFARTRMRIDTPGAGDYTVTHPYGIDKFTVAAGGTRTINETADVGIGAQGDFTGALNGRVGPWLKWDTGAPAGYLGDGATAHRVVGSPKNTNFIRITGPGVGTGSANQCTAAQATQAGVAVADCVQTDLFTVAGKIATNLGGQTDRAVYSQDASGGKIQVYAHSEANQAMQVERDDAAGISTTPLTGDGKGNYFGLVAFTKAKPAKVTVINAGDNPVSKSTVPLVDQVTITKAEFDTATGKLTVAAASGDAAAPPVLTVTGIGDLAQGAGSFDVPIPPLNVEVTSKSGGKAAVPATVVGTTSPGITLAASAVAPASAPLGAAVTLDGSGSVGDIATFNWAQTGGPAVTLTNATTAKAGFTAPATAAVLEFTLTVTDAAGRTATKPVSVTIAAQPLVASAVATPASAAAGATVTLDGSGSTGAASYSWAQTGGTPTVTLTGAGTAKSTFVMPVTTAPLTFTLTVKDAAGAASTATATVGPVVDTLAFTQAQFRRGTGELRISGTATAPLPDAVAIYLDGSTTPIANATAIAVVAGQPQTWDFRVRNGFVLPNPNGAHTITVKSTRGGTVTGPLTVRN